MPLWQSASTNWKTNSSLIVKTDSIMKKCIIILLVFCTTALSVPAFAQYVNLLDQTVSTAIDGLVEQTITDNNLPGVSIGIVYDRQIVYTNGYGWAKRNKTDMSASTVMRWGSISKTVTGVLVMKLVENGDIQLDDPVTDYVPEYENDDVTIRQLLSHQSGTRHYDDDCTFSPYYSGAFNATKSLDIVEKCGLLFTPGTDTNYSTFGFVLLGVLVDRVGIDAYGKGYEALFEDWIKNEMGLSTMQADNTNTLPDMATGYEPLNTATNNVPNVGWKLPAGGFASNVYDLTRFMLGLMDNRFINETTSETMWTDQTLNDGTTTGFGLGVFIDESSGDLGVWHNGISSAMSNTLMDFFPEQQLGVVIMTNDGRPGNVAFPIIRELKEQILDVVRCPQSRAFVGSGGLFGRNIHYEAADFIEASLFEISDSKVVFDAGNTIRLKPGFKALEGTQFKAIIDGCEGASTPDMARVSSDPTTKPEHQLATPKTSNEIVNIRGQLLSIMPNPFNDIVKIDYEVKDTSEVSLVLYNMQGNEVRRQLNHVQQSPGVYQVEMNGQGLPDGMYLYHLQIGFESITGKLIKKQ